MVGVQVDCASPHRDAQRSASLSPPPLPPSPAPPTMSSVAGRKRSLAAPPVPHIDSLVAAPVAHDSFLNKSAAQSTSTYQQCSHLRSRLLFCLLSRFNTACCSCTCFKSISGRKESGKCIIRAPLIYPSIEQRKGVAFALRGVPQAHNYFVSRRTHHSISRHSTYTLQYERSQNSQVLHDTV